MRYAWTADGAAAVEALRAELAQGKEQARASNAAALKAAEELCHAQYATLSKRNSKVPPRIDPHIETLLQGGYHYINIT